MKIGLIDVDSHNFPNLALMKLSAWHKQRGDQVDWWNGFEHYERVYMSKVFTFSPDVDAVIDADEIVKGGTGYKDYACLTDEIDSISPDYTIYPSFKQAIGFLTRGCIRLCPWCIVPRKEGRIRPAATWQEIKRTDSKEIIFLDNNVLACDHGISQIESMGGQPIWVDFNQGLDARLITPTVAGLLARLHWIRFVRLSCDTSSMLPVIEQAISYMKEAGIAKTRFWSYMLVQDVEEAQIRALKLQQMGVTPFAQPYRDYDGNEPTEEQRRLARWINHKAIFKSCRWENYKSDYSKHQGGTQHERQTHLLGMQKKRHIRMSNGKG